MVRIDGALWLVGICVACRRSVFGWWGVDEVEDLIEEEIVDERLQ